MKEFGEVAAHTCLYVKLTSTIGDWTPEQSIELKRLKKAIDSELDKFADTDSAKFEDILTWLSTQYSEEK